MLQVLKGLSQETGYFNRKKIFFCIYMENLKIDEGTYRHSLPIQIRFNDVDRFGHVNNNMYFSYYDLGKQEYLQSVLSKDFMQNDLVPVVVNIHADFFAPVYYADEIVVQTRISHIGDKSFVLQQRAVNTTKNQVVCQCSTVMVCYSLKLQASVSLPDEYRKNVSEYEQRAF